jgi:Xaa-Pro dipeptidase
MKSPAAVNPGQARIEKIREWMAQEEISLVMFEDTEGRRDQTIRWLCGHPCDALFFLSHNGKTMLVPWDINLAKAYASADIIIPYGEFNRIPLKAIAGAAEKLSIPRGSKIEIPPVTPYPQFLNFVGELANYDIICHERSAVSHAQMLRAIKDADEIKIIKKVAGITNEIIDLLEKKVRGGKLKTEADAALLIEVEARRRGCDGTGFETIAAGAQRSYCIHAFPSWTGEPFAEQGLSILDFGIKLHGYTTDVTLTFVREPKVQQERMVNYVERAFQLAVAMTEDQVPVRQLALAVDIQLERYKKVMPHSLGHGIGLEEHEYPIIKVRDTNELLLEKGMFFSLEPGLYDPQYGGCRLENDVLLTESGPEILTNARIIRL